MSQKQPVSLAMVLTGCFNPLVNFVLIRTPVSHNLEGPLAGTKEAHMEIEVGELEQNMPQMPAWAQFPWYTPTSLT